MSDATDYQLDRVRESATESAYYTVDQEKKKRTLIAGLFCVGISSILLTATLGTSESPSLKLTVKEAAETNLLIGVSNEYIEKLGAIGLDYQYPSTIVDVFKPATFSVTDKSVSDVDYTYKWYVDESTHAMEGKSLTTVFSDIGSHKVLVQKIDPISLTMVDASEMTVRSKYVRREIRELSDEDRTNFFDALQVMYTTSQDEGSAKYGSSYRSIEYFVTIHNNAAGDSICDHFHDGLAFMPSHIGLTNLLEASLQAIDPSVTVPYWDYTIEGQLNADSMDFTASVEESVIFDDDWFGDLHPDNEVGVMTEGRWAYLPALKASDYELESLVNPYGFIRSPWNANAVPYVTRYSTVFGSTLTAFPSCVEHYDMVANTESFYDFSMDIEYQPHGIVHTVVGGVGLSNMKTALEELTDMDVANIDSIATDAFIIQKVMYRTNLLSCPTSCSSPYNESTEAIEVREDVPNWTLNDMMSCKCTCSSDDDDGGVDYDAVWSVLGNMLTDRVDEDNEDELHAVMDILCNSDESYGPAIIGDSLESASPADPIFWVIHPTVERLFMKWYDRNEGTLDMSWPDDTSTTMLDPLGTCYGHDAYDSFEWATFGDSDKALTNTEMVQNVVDSLVDPDSLPYVYHHFTWSHCVADGYSIDFE